MTAFARCETDEQNLTVLTEIRSYNSRHLDIVLRLHHQYSAFENKIKKLAAKFISRGRLEISLQIKEDPNEDFAYELNNAKAKAYHEALCELKKKYGIDSDIALDLMISAGDIIKPVEEEKELDLYWPAIEASVSGAMNALNDMREKEGKFISRDIRNRLDRIDQAVQRIKSETMDLILQYKDRLMERINTLTEGLVELDTDRIAQEAAFLADKSDISEEIVRALSHLKQFYAIMDSGQPAGRKLNFLIQELNREFNTMGSKVGKAHVSHMIVDIKSELEKIREQVQNIE